MAKPFISHDGTDGTGQRAEVFVQTGTGLVYAVEGKDGSKANVLVKIRAPHLTRPVQGWLSKVDPLYPIVLAAHESGRDVDYRVESQRKSGVPRDTPIGDLRKDTETAAANCINLIAGIDGTLSKEAVTDPAEDPHAGGRIPATGRAAAPAAAPAATAPPAAGPAAVSAEQALTALAAARTAGLPAGVIDASMALALAAGATARQVVQAGVTSQQEAQPRPLQRAFAHEAAPHVVNNTDGRLNLGNYAVQSAFGAEQVAYSLIRDHHEAIADETGEAPQPVSLPQAAGLAGVLLQLADRVQIGAYDGGRPDRMAASHTRARGLIYDAVRTRHPVPFEAETAQRIEWMDAVVAEGVSRFRLLVSIAEQVYQEPADEETDSADETPAETAGDETPNASHTAETPADDTANAETAGDGTMPADETSSADAAQGDAQPTRPRPPVEGEDGFVAPDPATIQRFARLAQAAGFTATPDSPVLAYLADKFGVSVARKVHAPALSDLVDWYEQRGEQASAVFAEHVDRVTGATERRSA